MTIAIFEKTIEARTGQAMRPRAASLTCLFYMTNEVKDEFNFLFILCSNFSGSFQYSSNESQQGEVVQLRSRPCNELWKGTLIVS